jgi:membrane fusion protein (multidrug efflux system)
MPDDRLGELSTERGELTAEEIRQLREYIERLERGQIFLREEQERLRAQLAGQSQPEPPPAELHEEPAKDRLRPSRPRPAKILLLLAVLAALSYGGFFLLQYLHTFESTDDAQVDGHINAVTTRMDGTLARIYVEDNQMVRAGQLLADIDPRDFQVAVEQARAALAQAQAQVRAEDPNIPIIETSNLTSVSNAEADVLNAQAAILAAERDYEAAIARVREAEANNARAQADAARYKMLVNKDEVSRQEYDQASAAAQAAAAMVESSRASAAAAEKVVDQRRAQLAQAQSRLAEANANGPRQLLIRRANVAVRRTGVAAAKAALDRALLDLSYCKIFAPVSGIVISKGVEAGQRLSAGQRLLSLVQVDDLWVTANFKETQLRRMRPQQRVTIKVDAFRQTFEGYVESMPGATGAKTSLLPPENATGNYVKVVQRLPVRIRFQPGQPGLDRLRPGMSVEPQVWLR